MTSYDKEIRAKIEAALLRAKNKPFNPNRNIKASAMRVLGDAIVADHKKTK